MQRQRVPHRRALSAGAAVVAAAAALALPSTGRFQDEPGVSFAAEIQPIFDRKCTSCHPVSYPYLDLRRGRAYGDLVRVPAATAPAFERVLPGRPELSYLLTHPPDPSLRGLLSAAERGAISEWIRQGARNN